MNGQRVETRWCPAHDREMLKRGTARCRRCTADVCLPKPHRVSVSAARLTPMREKGAPTQRAVERWKKGYARA